MAEKCMICDKQESVDTKLVRVPGHWLCEQCYSELHPAGGAGALSGQDFSQEDRLAPVYCRRCKGHKARVALDASGYCAYCRIVVEEQETARIEAPARERARREEAREQAKETLDQLFKKSHSDAAAVRLNVRFVAGDFSQQSSLYVTSNGDINVGRGPGSGRTRLTGNVDRVEILTTEQSKALLGSVGWGMVGFAVFGLLGAAAGMMKGGNRTTVLFACYLKDGRKFMASGDQSAYQKVAALAF